MLRGCNFIMGTVMMPVTSRPGLQGNDGLTGARSKCASEKGAGDGFLMLMHRLGQSDAGDSRSSGAPRRSGENSTDQGSVPSARKDAESIAVSPPWAEIEEVDLSRVDPAVLQQSGNQSHEGQGEEPDSSDAIGLLLPTTAVAPAPGDRPGLAGSASQAGPAVAGAPISQAISVAPQVMHTAPLGPGAAAEAAMLGEAGQPVSTGTGPSSEAGLNFQAGDDWVASTAGRTQAGARPAAFPSLLSQSALPPDEQLQPAVQMQPGSTAPAAPMEGRAEVVRSEPLFGALFAVSSTAATEARADVRLRRGSGGTTGPANVSLPRSSLPRSDTSAAARSLEVSASIADVLPKGPASFVVEHSVLGELQALHPRDAGGQENFLRAEGQRALPEGQRPFSAHVASQVSEAVVRSGMRPDGKLRELRITLRPEHLGQVDVRLETRDEVSRALVRTETQQAADLLRAEIRTLEQALRDAGFKLDQSIEVQVREQGRGSEERREQGFGQRQGGEGPGRDADQGDREPDEGAVRRLLDPNGEIAVVI